MFLARPFLLFGLASALVVFSSPAEAARKKAKKGGEHLHHGMVESVNHKTGTFTIKASHHHKNGTARKGTVRRAKAVAGKNRGSGQNMTFQVTAKTNFQGGSFKSLHKGEHVVVMAKGHHADDVKIGQGKGKGKPKRNKQV